MTRVAPAILLALALSLNTSSVQGQGRPAMKRGLPVVAARPSCQPATPTPAKAPTAQQRRQARELAQRAQQSAILGDRNAARDQLRQATTLDPANPELAYQLARAQEALDARDEAVAEYCRFLALAPSAPEAAEVRDRVAGMARSTQSAVSEKILAPFRAGVTAYDAGRFAQAEAAFSSAIALQPDWAEAYFNRALTNAARGRREVAITDLQQYLRLRPEAEDRAAVVARISDLRARPPSPTSALAMGIVIPGSGQLYTGRKLFGVTAMAATGGLLAFAFKSDQVTKEYLVTPTDPFGNPLPPYTETRSETGRPNVTLGVSAAAAVALGAAVESYFYARRLGTRDPRFSATVLPSVEGLALRVTLR